MFVSAQFRTHIAAAIFLFLTVSSSAQTAEQKAAASAFIDALAAHNWMTVQAIAHPDLQKHLTEASFVEIIGNLEKKAGPLQYHRYYSAHLNQSYANIVHRLYFVQDSLALRIVVDSLNYVGGIWVEPIEKQYLFSPPAYADTTRFYEEDIVVGDEFPLPGVISVPTGEGLFPAVVLVHGSGAQDKDETIFGNKIFRDLAWGLASQGIMVLRYDKRTYVHARKMKPLTTTVQDETIDDAVEALHLLRKHKAADSARIILLGHSLGAMLAPEIASLSGVAKGLIMLAPIARPLETVIADQLRFISSLRDSLTQEENKKLYDELEKAAEISSGTMGKNRLFLGAPASYYYDLHKRDQKTYALSLGVPIFIARGDKDYQSPQMEYMLWQKYLQNLPNITFKTYRNCYHLFIETDAKPGPLNYSEEGHVTEQLINDVISWCKTFTLTETTPTGEMEYKVR